MDQLKQQPHRRRGANGGGRRVYALLRAQVADGTLAPGARVPSTRALAADLGVSRSTVTTAYEQLVAEGFLVTAAGRAARVAAPLAAGAAPGRLDAPPAAPVPPLSAWGRRVEGMAGMALQASAPQEAAPIDFLYGAVASRDFPALAWRRVYQAELLRQQHRLYYAEPEGDPALRRALQGYLARARGLVCDAGQILIVHGTQQALDLCARLLLEAADTFVFEEPGYPMARQCFEAIGARLLPVAVDAQGLDTSRLPRGDAVRLAYVTPSHQFPLGGVLPMARRVELLQWARQHGAWIVEDDYDGEFRYGQRPIDALQAMDTDGRVLYIGTFSKALSPQLRLGYLVLPAALVPVFRQARRLADRHAPVIEQRVLASLMESGAYERHIRRLRRAHERRRVALLEAIARYLPASAQVAGTAAGLHVVLWLPSVPQQDEAQLVAAARAAGVGVYPVTPLFAGPQVCPQPRPAGLTLGYASLSEDDIQLGIRTLAAVVARLERSE